MNHTSFRSAIKPAADQAIACATDVRGYFASQRLNPVQQFAIALSLHASAVTRLHELPQWQEPTPERIARAKGDVIVFARMARRYASRLNAALAVQRSRYGVVPMVANAMRSQLRAD